MSFRVARRSGLIHSTGLLTILFAWSHLARTPSIGKGLKIGSMVKSVAASLAPGVAQRVHEWRTLRERLRVSSLCFGFGG